HSASWSWLLSQHGLRSRRYMELGLAPRRKKSGLGHRAWFCPLFGGTVSARPSPAEPAVYLGGSAGLVGPLAEPDPNEGAGLAPSLPALALCGCRGGEASDRHGVDRHCSSRQLEFDQCAAAALAYRQTLRLGTDRGRTGSALALSDLRWPHCGVGAASQSAHRHLAVDTEPAPDGGTDRSAAGIKPRERERAAPGRCVTHRVAGGHRHPRGAPPAAES